jgi:hypothetical protein
MSPNSRYAPSFLIDVKGVKLEHGTTIDVQSVSVTETFNKADSFRFTVAERYPEAGRLFAGGDRLRWMDSDVFDERNAVEIYLGYVDDMPLMLRGEITATSASFPSNGQPTLTVEGQSLYNRLFRKQQCEPFKKMTDSDIAKRIAELPNLKWDAEVDPTSIVYPLVSPGGMTLGAFLLKRAQRIGYELTVKDRTLYFQQPRYIAEPDPALTLEWGVNLISFTPRLSANNVVTEVAVRGMLTAEGSGKDPVVGTARAGNERVKLGSQTGGEIAQGISDDNRVLLEEHSLSSVQEANDLALAHLETQAMEFIFGRGSCIGNHELSSRQVVELIGLGKRFSGRYYVTSTTHTIDSSGYRTDFEVRRNAR